MIEKDAKKISFHFLVKPVTLPQRKLLKHFIALLFKSETHQFESLTVIFCSDEYLLSINKEFLGHNYYTDIITFNLAEKSLAIVGELYISIDRIRDNAKQLGISVVIELTRVLFHGVLHLCGYKDKEKSSILIMRAKEEFYLKAYADYKNVSRGTH